MNSPEIIPGALLKNTFVFLIFQISSNILILEYSFFLSFSNFYDCKIQNSSIQSQISTILVSKFLSNYPLSNHVIPLSMVHIPENSKNTLVLYSTYNFPIRTEPDNSFTTILINSKLHRTKPYAPSYKYTQRVTLSLPTPSAP